MNKLFCATLDSYQAKIVEVEVSFIRALPAFSIVGLAQTSIQESKDRVKSALDYIGFKLPPLKVTLSLLPSDLRKEGSHFDLSIALLVATYKDKNDTASWGEDIFVFGELGLNGYIRDTKAIFPIVLSLASKKPHMRVLASKESLPKLSKIPDVKVYSARDLKEAISIVKDLDSYTPATESKIPFDYAVINKKNFFYNKNFKLDFKDIKGQEIAKRASLIAASGMHNLLLEGSPGCGKSMSAKRIRYILPPLSLDEILKISSINSIESEKVDFSPLRSFRSPHHSSTRASIFGGGSSKAKIGEVALANRGILFFDEFPHFQKSVLDSLREPLEDYKILVSRVHSKIEYETKFLFIAAMNPCPCGNLFSKHKECRCSDIDISRYKSRLSEPLLDRIDLFVQMDEANKRDRSSMHSKSMYDDVLRVFIIQKKRGQEELNGFLKGDGVEKYCILDEDAKCILSSAIDGFGLSHRRVDKAKKIARTIADLENSHLIKKNHIMEALSFRRRWS